MFRQYRKIERGEFFVIGADCSQGGKDYNSVAFLSKTKLDVPLVYHSRGVAANMTSIVHPVIEKIFDVTGLEPVVAFETNNGGASEMERLSVLNRAGKYRLFTMPTIGKSESSDTGKYGYVTSSSTRPILLGDFKNAVDHKAIRIYDDKTVKELLSFIVSDSGKPEAEKSAHDDLVFAHAIAWQLYQLCETPDLNPYTTNRVHIPSDDVIGI